MRNHPQQQITSWLRPVLVTVLFFCGTAVLSAQEEEYLDSCWTALEQTLVADDATTLWPQLRALEEASQADYFEGFLERAIRFVTRCYESGAHSESSTYLQHLDSVLNKPNLADEIAIYRCDVLYHLGRVHSLMQETELAQAYAEASIECSGENGLTSVLGYNLLGGISENLDNLDDAKSYYRLALAKIIDDAEMDGANEREIRESLANTFYETGLYKQAQQEYEAALELSIQEHGPDHYAVAGALINLAACEDQLGLLNRAKQHYEEALRILQLQEDLDEMVMADLYSKMGVIFWKNSAYVEAIRYYEQARSIYEQQAEPPLAKLAAVHTNMANVYTSKKDYDEALHFHQQALTLNKQSNNAYGIAENYSNLGIVASKKEDWPLAKSYFERALEQRTDATDFKSDMATDHINLANANLALEEFTPAKAHAEVAAALQRALLGKRNPQRAYTLIVKARIAQAQDRIRRALENAHKSLIANHETFSESFKGNKRASLPDLEGYFRYDYMLESLLLKAELLKAIAERYNEPEDLIAAQVYYRHALDLLDKVRRELTSREDQITLVENVYRTATAAMEGYLRLYQQTGEESWLADAFYCSEKSKASVLQAAIIANEAQRFGGVPPELPQQEAQLQADIGYYKRQLATSADSLERRELRAELFASQEAYNQLLNNYRQQYPEYYELRHQQELPTLSEVQLALRPDQMILSYFTTETVVYRFEISQSKVVLTATPLPARFASDIRGLNKSITRQLDEVYLKKARQLGELLLPATLNEAQQELIIVPDGLLLRVPFEALLTETESSDSPDYQALPYLIQKYQLQYSPSVTLFHQANDATSKAPEQRTSGLLAYAPVFPGTSAIQAATRATPFAEERITPLPETEREVSQLARLFEENDRQTQTSLHQSASEHALKESELGQYRFLHVATHGFVNEAEPDLSGLLLYPDSTAGEDGLLAVGEVYNLRLNTDLVTLSACETGIGQIANGEGVLGFTRAFLYAGAERVLVSLWQVQDAATAELMLAFYERILQTPSPDYSSQLQRAKLQLIESGNYSHPYYWSPFVLIRG
ncbi:MAG: CHAT domain-containing tetratricopeptide repeat protein [Bacteroidota bacterium]